MRCFRNLMLTACLSAVSFAWVPIASANQSSFQSKAAEMEQLRAALGDRTMMDIMEVAAKKDPSYTGPAYLFPASRLMIRKSYLPHYFDAIDHFHETTAVPAKFTAGKGDQTQNLTPMNIGNAILFTSKRIRLINPWMKSSGVLLCLCLSINNSLLYDKTSP